MDAKITKICFLLSILNPVVLATDISDTNATDSDIRQPRVNGRIVKLYSGPRPEPIYCPEEGFQPDPVNCAIFYRCVKGNNNKFTVFRFQCGPGTVYDPDTEVCNFPQSTKRSECGGIAFPSQDKTNENEIVESRPEFPSPINTRPGYSEDIKESTAYPWAPPKIENAQSPSTAYPWMTSGTNQPSLPLKGTPHQPSIPSRQNGDACSKDGFMGDSENCRRFYRCVNNQRGGFIRYEFTCSETTIWDDDAQSCNHPWAVQKSRCGRSNIDNSIEPSNTNKQSFSNKSSSPGTTIQEQLQINYGEKVSQTQTQISHGDGVIQNQTQINYGDHNENKPSSAAKQNQTQISHGSAVSQTQTQINHGNGVQTQLQIDHTKETSQSQSQTYETTSKTSTTSGTTVENEQDQVYGLQPSTEGSNGGMNNKNECTESGFMGDKNDCNKFYRCVDNGKGGYIKYEFQCGEGTVWDSSIEGCNHAWAVKNCGSSSSTDVTKEETTTTQSTPITVSLVQTTTQASSENIDYDSGYGQQPSEASSTTSTKNPMVNTKPTEQTTTGRPTPGKECSQEGFMGDNDDCNKFYRCVDNGQGGFTKYEFKCGEGTVWDSEITACNHPKSATPCSGGSSSQGENISENPQTSTTTQSSQTSGTQTTNEAHTTSKPSSTSKPPPVKDCSQEGFMGDENDCEKFYRCVDNGEGGFTKYEFTCGEGTVWDSEIQTCNHPSSSKKCGSSSSQTSDQQASTEPNRENDELYSESTNIQASSTEQSHTTSSSEKPTGSNDKCTSEGFYGDSNDCKKFYRCVDNGNGGFTKYEFTCGDGTVWDQEVQTCNYEPSDSKCSRDSPSQSQAESSDGTTSTTQSTIPEQQSTQKPQSSASNNCTAEGFYANTEDCKKFYRCVDNGNGGYTKYDFSCGEGTMWVQETQTCDHDTGDSCSSLQSESSSSTTESSSDQQSSSSPSSTEQPNKQEDENSNGPSSESTPTGSSDNNEKCTAEGFYANKNDCKKFYRCVDNGNGGFTKYDFTCGEGTAWDSDIQSCNHISEVKSCQGQQQETSQPMQDEQVSQSPGETQTSTSGPATEGSKPASNDKCEKEGYYGNSQDCTKFYRCVDNGNGGFTKYDFDCGEGTIWDQDVTTCNHPRDVSNPSCQQSDNSESSTSSSSTTSSSTSSSGTSSSGTSSSSTTESSSSDCSGSTKKPAKNNVNCTKAGYYPDPDDCKKFYRCVDWDGDGKKFSVYHFDCGEGTIWDPALDTCNHEDSVYPPRDCSGGSQSQGENVDQETTKSTTTTTTESGTTQESTTEQTTQETTTTEQTTSSEHTTTEKTTTSEQTTTQQSTTSEQTTTQQSTTSEQTTTQQSTTSEQTTTQQSTTSEQTTTQQSTTSEQTTTQHTTTEESTEKQTTTEQTTTSEQTTTQESTTEQTTESDQSSTTQQTTNTQGTTTESTTESTTTEGTTTAGTTEQSTTSQTDETESTDSTTSTTTSSTDESTTESSGDQTTESPSDKECPETEDDQNLFVCPTSFKRHPKYCNMFYQCTEDDDTHDVQIATFHCPNNTIYDESKTQCVEEKKADKKCNGEMARKRRLKRYNTVSKEPIIVTNERLKCPAPGHYPFEKGECSPAFLKCQTSKTGKIRGFIYQCPQDHVYWSVSRRCEQKSNVRDCKKSHNDWKGRWEIPVERRNVAP